jgi:hypothetical protein
MDVERGVAVVAKKRKLAESADAGMSMIQVTGTKRWCEWVAGLAEADRRSISNEVEVALAERAKAIGHADPPKRRGG